MSNPDVAMTLDQAVGEVLGLLTGLDLTYDPKLDRYRAVVRQLNRALRSMALEHEWSYYSSVETLGPLVEGSRTLSFSATLRPRLVGDDALRLVTPDGDPVEWCYVLPRDALHKYAYRPGLWAAATRTELTFSRPINYAEAGYSVELPVMREPVLFRLPDPPEDPDTAPAEVPAEIRDQEVDFDYPDVVILRAAFYYAQTDPVMQPRVQTLEAQYKDLMYQLIERDDRSTDMPFQNEFFVPVQNGLYLPSSVRPHPVSDRRRIGWE